MDNQEIDKEIKKKLFMLNESIVNIAQLNSEFLIETRSIVEYINYLIDLKSVK